MARFNYKAISRRVGALSTPERHQLRIAKRTLELTCIGAHIMGGMDHRQATETIHRLTGVVAGVGSDCTCFQVTGGKPNV